MTELPVALVVSRRSDGRCVYSAEGRQALIDVALSSKQSIAELARQHDLNANVLRRWISESLKANAGSGPTRWTPVALRPPALSPGRSPLLEIEVVGMTVRLHGAIDEVRLRTVLRCVRQP
jgi:transposase-like protein